MNKTIPESYSPQFASAGYRHIASVDLMRGLVMALMALDHVRGFFSDAGFSPTDLAHTDPALFFTRWITHLCAPAFVFLAGTSAFLSATHGLDRPQLAKRLFARGLWLVLLELTVVHLAWTFNLDFSQTWLGVIWALGWSMVALSALVYLPMRAIAFIGIGMILLHNLFDDVRLEDFQNGEGVLSWQGWLISVLHIPHSPVGYPLIPWIGVMMAGYAFGPFMLMKPQERKRITLRWGLILIATFIVLRAVNGYGDPAPWFMQKTGLFTVLSFLNTTKYPPSLLYLMMTLGPMLILLSAFERWPDKQDASARLLIVFGRVPLFFYLLHLYAIHGLVLVFAFLMACEARSFLASSGDFPPWWGFSLPMVYLIWIGILLLLYPLCRWFAAVKFRHKGAWWTPYI
jgi:uncharacterized membrane protein